MISEQAPLVQLQDVVKVYDREVLRVENLELNRGCIYGIIGPSGSGKSTLLRIVNLLTLPEKGMVLFEGKPVPTNGEELLRLQRRMSLVFQKTLLFRDSVFNNVAFGLKVRGFNRNEIVAKVTELLTRVGLIDLARRRADTLSGGEAQRVAIARAVAFEPELLLLDEPTANLDPANIELIEEMITGLAREKCITVVIVTHNVFQARRIADQVLFVSGGAIVEMAPTEKLFGSPDKDSTRLFIEGKTVY